MQLRGSDEMTARIRAFDWSVTPLGPMSSWPPSLLTALGMLLGSRFPMQLLWGPDYIHFYNEAYLPIAAGKHPHALGRPGAAIWPEVWAQIKPMLEQVRSSGKATFAENLLLLLDRRGYIEEGYYTFSYSPIYDEQSGVGGIFIAVTETTGHVIRERRLRILDALAARLSAAPARGLTATIAEVLRRAAADMPFTLLYLLDGAGQSARLVLAEPAAEGHPAAPPHIALDDAEAPWALAAALRSEQPQLVDGAAYLAGGPPGGPAEGPYRALALPLSAGGSAPIGVLVAGLSPRLPLDDEYRDFVGRLAAQIGAAVGRAQAEAETQAMIQARDDFLSIAAHELKTPLTPIVGKLQLLQRRLARGGAAERELQSIQVVVDEALRLNGMIDDLLDISRLRSGQLAISRLPIDLATIAAQVAVEVAPTLSIHHVVLDAAEEPVIVDGDDRRLTQVVRNLVSNAVKYSPTGGQVTIQVAREGRNGFVAVSDSGVGVPAEALPRLFDRYYRVAEGSGSVGGLGVGLYVVNEIVRLHGGQIRVASTPGAGSTFTVALPLAG